MSNMLPMVFNRKRDEFLTPFDKLFDDMMSATFPTFRDEVGLSFENSAYPKVNVTDHKDKLRILTEIPGLDKKQVSVEVTDGVLTISGGKRDLYDGESNDVNFIRRELKHSSFKRSFNLGDNLNHSDVSAKFDNGILIVDVPKTEPEKPKKKFIKIA
jgi:HSP20 family protein